MSNTVSAFLGRDCQFFAEIVGDKVQVRESEDGSGVSLKVEGEPHLTLTVEYACTHDSARPAGRASEEGGTGNNGRAIRPRWRASTFLSAVRVSGLPRGCPPSPAGGVRPRLRRRLASGVAGGPGPVQTSSGELGGPRCPGGSRKGPPWARLHSGIAGSSRPGEPDSTHRSVKSPDSPTNDGTPATNR